jgi:predicted TIM-barrel fold metal-dependent hydrolase
MNHDISRRAFDMHELTRGDTMPILVDEVAKNHPKLRIIIAHAGGAAFCRQALAVAQSNRNCYLDLSATIQEDSGWYIPTES